MHSLQWKSRKSFSEIGSPLKSAKDGGVIPPLLSQAVEHGRACGFVTSRSKFAMQAGCQRRSMPCLRPTRLRSPCSGMTPIPGWCTASARRRRTRPCSALRRCHKVCLYLYRISHVGPIASRIGESEGVGVGSATDLSRPKLSRSQECS